MSNSGSQDIFRKYPKTYEGVIPILCSNLDELDEPEAKASLIWIVGEYADTIDNASELLKIFVDSFTEEAYPVCITLFWFLCSHSVDRAGATANSDSRREVVFEEARFITSSCTRGTQYCNQRLRLS